MGRAVASCRENDLAIGQDLLALARTNHLDADRSPSLEEDASREPGCYDRKVLAVPGRVQVGNGRAASSAVALRDLMISDAVLSGPVKIRIKCQSQIPSRGKESLRRSIFRAPVADRERAEVTMELVLAALVAFRLDEVGKDVPVAPVCGSVGSPVVIVKAVAAYVDHSVHGAGAAQ